MITDPRAFGLDVLLPAYFVALVLSFRTRRSWGLSVAVSAAVAVAVYYAPAAGIEWLGPPWHVTIGGLAGILVAAARAPEAPPPEPDAADAPDVATAEEPRS